MFASTNVDDIVVLLGFLSDPRFRVRHIVLGQYIGIAALTATSIVFSLAALVIPPAYVGLLGVAPLAIGLWKLLRHKSAFGDELSASPRANVLAVTAVTVATGETTLLCVGP